jgi:hypothetical protein
MRKVDVPSISGCLDLLVAPRIAKIGVERKTGVKHAEVLTVGLVRDERGWLRLAG